MPTYQWKSRARSTIPCPAQIAGERLERIRARNDGVLTKAAVVEDARPKSSPLHKCFEWNDKIAAETFRETQAGYIIRQLILVTQEDEDDEPQTIRAFVSVDCEEDGEEDEPQTMTFYTSTEVAMRDKGLRKQVLRRAWRELEVWRERYRKFEELAQIFEAMELAQEREE